MGAENYFAERDGDRCSDVGICYSDRARSLLGLAGPALVDWLCRISRDLDVGAVVVGVAAVLVVAVILHEWTICSVHFSQLTFGNWTSVSKGGSYVYTGRVRSRTPSASTGICGLLCIAPEMDHGPFSVSRVTATGSAGNSSTDFTASETR